MKDKKISDMTSEEKLAHYGPCTNFDICGGPAESYSGTLCRRCAGRYYYWGNGKSIRTPAQRLNQLTHSMVIIGAFVRKQELTTSRSLIGSKIYKPAYMPGQVKGQTVKRKKYKR